MRTALLATAFASMMLCTLAARSQQQVSPEEARGIVRDAYVYAYPLLLHKVGMRQTTNYAEPTGIPRQGPFNQFAHGRTFPPADFKIIVRANVDTLYSVASLDLGPEPIVLSVPATDRYFMLPMLSLWTDVFAVPGTRTTGRNTAREFLVTGPNWHGTVPDGLEIIKSPTRLVTIIGRTQTNGVSDYDTVHKIQASYKITPLSSWGKGNYVAPKGKVDPTLDMKTPPPDQIDAMNAATFFAHFALLLKDNPPGPFDYPMIHRLERVGFKAGESFNLNTASPDIKEAFELGTADGKAEVLAAGKKAAGEGGKGWVYRTNGGAYGVDYLYRAAIAQCCLGLNLPQDALYPSTSTDSQRQPLDGHNKYTLHFKKSKFPPVDGFWSVTAYDKDGYFIPNSLNRQALGDRDKLATNADGSIDLLIQANSPGASVRNSAAQYDFAIADLRAAVKGALAIVSSVPIPPGVTIGAPVSPGDPIPPDAIIGAPRQGAKPKKQGQSTLDDIDRTRTVTIPDSAKIWMRSEVLPPLPKGYTLAKPSQPVIWETQIFPATMSDADVMKAFQTDQLQPRPKFSLGSSVRAHTWNVIGGLALFISGLSVLGWSFRGSSRASDRES